ILGNLVIDPAAGDTSTVRLIERTVGGVPLPFSGSNQIADNVVVSFLPGGLLDLNNNNETVGGLNMTQGTVQTGLGELTLTGNVTTNASDRAAFINGHLNLGSASRAFTVPNGLVAADLVINAAIRGGAAVQLIKEGTGLLSLTGDNVY